MIYRTERCNARASGDRSLSFFPVKGALTHHLQSRRWYPSLRSGSCALRGGCGSCGSLQTMPWHLRVLPSLPAVLKVVWVKKTYPTSAPCENLPPAALSQLWTELAARPFSFSEKKQKQGHAVSACPGKDAIYYGNLSSGSKGRKPWSGSKCLRCGGVYELFCHL